MNNEKKTCSVKKVIQKSSFRNAEGGGGLLENLSCQQVQRKRGDGKVSTKKHSRIKGNFSCC